MQLSESEDSNQQKVESLTDWFTQHGAWLHPSITIDFHDQYGYSMRAGNGRIEAPFDAVRCPLSISLSHLNIDPEQKYVPHVKSDLLPCLGKLPNEVLARLLLIEQLTLEDESRWAPYVDCLPDAEELQTATSSDSVYFEGTPIERAQRERREALVKEWENARAVMKEVGLEKSEVFEESDFEQYSWASNIMSSRAFTSGHILPHLDPFPVLYPVLDIANHNTTTKVRWEIDNEPKDAQDNQYNAAFRLRLLDNVEPHGQIYNNYGPKSNAELLLGYGFALENNPVEQFPFVMMTPPEAVTCHEKHQIPFGMREFSLTSEGAGLRKCGNLLGRYRNDIPFFQGIPSHAVFGTWIFVLKTRNIDPTKAGPEIYAVGRLAIATLVVLYEVILARCSAYPFQYKEPESFQASLDRYAWLYRAGQADICHSIRRELKAVLENLRMSPRRNPSTGSLIITLSDALGQLRKENTSYFGIFCQSMRKLFNGLDVSFPKAIARNSISEPRLWVFMLLVFRRVLADAEISGANSVISAWTQDLLKNDEIFEAKLKGQYRDYDINGRGVEDFLRQLETIKSMYAEMGEHADRAEMWSSTPSEVAWALRVVHMEAFLMPYAYDRTLMSWCMYMRPLGSEESWMYEPVTVPPQEPEGEEADPAPLGKKFQSMMEAVE